ncbi:rRNA maturation RNase YbeY [Plastorhodobacter daqingensis]|uniref:Endoribonuclease YbeY n=1 Tax=Plastorhodobacter daqingensis TaxID=1387281 RepID=A0ABW2UET2_9RHOB
MSFQLVDTVIEDPRWDRAGLETLAERAGRAALAGLGLDPAGFEISLLGCDDDRIAALNADFRGKPQPTNVLSWPAEDRAAAEGEMPDLPQGDPSMPQELGDVAIAYDTCQREAQEQGKAFDAHVTHLLVHGMLHLLGFDHIRDSDAVVMEALEVRILAGLGLSDPYGDAGDMPDKLERNDGRIC